MTGGRTTPSWGDAAEDWLTAKRVGRRKDDVGHADRARRSDLRRWAGVIDTVMGREPINSRHLDECWKNVMKEIGDVEVLVRALDLLGNELAVSSRVRMLSTLRGFCGYLNQRGLLTNDPTLAPELKVAAGSDDEVRAFTDDEVARLIAASYLPVSARVRSAWPARDAAIVDLLTHCGLRVGELCACNDSTIDRNGDRPLLRLTKGVKGGRHRVVPIPSPTLERRDLYRTERNRTWPSPDRLFVRTDGQPLNQQFVDALLRRLSLSASITVPNGAMAHALRHSYGMRLALRGVPLPIIQQLMGHVDPRTTSRYTRAHAFDLTDALADAGLMGPAKGDSAPQVRRGDQSAAQ